MQPPLLDSTAAAEYLSIAKQTLERMRLTGNGPVFVKLGPGRGARVAYRLADLDEWIGKNSFRSTGQMKAARRPSLTSLSVKGRRT